MRWSAGIRHMRWKRQRIFGQLCANWRSILKVVAFGETGLDYYWLPSRSSAAKATEEKDKEEEDERDFDLQRETIRLFRQHLEVAAETGLGVVVHERESMAGCADLVGAISRRGCAQFFIVLRAMLRQCSEC